MNIIIDLIRYTIPALVVFATVYYMLKYHYTNLYRIESAKLRKQSAETTLNLRLQAYERLAMFCERISPENLIIRLKTQAMDSGQLKNVMILAVKQEFDHNLTQQIYISEKLWEIIVLCKNQIIEIISATSDIDAQGNSNQFSNNLFNNLEKTNPIGTTLKAIRQEVEIYFS